MVAAAPRSPRSPPPMSSRPPGRATSVPRRAGSPPLGQRRGSDGLRARGSPGAHHAASRVRVEFARGSGTQSAIILAQEATGSRTCFRCATVGWPPRRSRSTAARRRSWRSTCRRRLGATSPSRPAATPTSRTSACSHPRTDARLRLERLRRDAARSVGMGRQAPRRERRDRGAQQRLHARRDADACRPRPCAPTASRWRRIPGCACSTSGTTGRPRTISRQPWPRRPRSLARKRLEGRRGAPRGHLREGSRQGPDEGERPLAASSTASGGSSTTRRRHPRRDSRRGAALDKTFREYRATLAENRRELVERYRFVDFALKVVGVGSVGTRCFVVLLEGRDEGDPLLLQAKEATASVLDPYLDSARTRTTASASWSASG